jgi:hypothetical protein
MPDFLQPCSPYSVRVLRRLNVSKFRQLLVARYQAALFYAQGQKELRPIWPRLPEGVVPRALPAISSDCSLSLRRLQETGVYASTWPRLPEAVRREGDRHPAFYGRVVVIPLAGPELLQGADPRKLLSHRPAAEAVKEADEGGR